MSSHEPLWSLRHSSAGRSVRLSVSVGVSGSRSVSLSLSLGRSEPWPVVPSFFLLLLSSCCWFGFPCLVAAENSTAFGIHQRLKTVSSLSNFNSWYSAKPASGCRPSRLFVYTDVCVCVCVFVCQTTINFWCSPGLSGSLLRHVESSTVSLVSRVRSPIFSTSYNSNQHITRKLLI